MRAERRTLSALRPVRSISGGWLVPVGAAVRRPISERLELVDYCRKLLGRSRPSLAPFRTTGFSRSRRSAFARPDHRFDSNWADSGQAAAGLSAPISRPNGKYQPSENVPPNRSWDLSSGRRKAAGPALFDQPPQRVRPGDDRSRTYTTIVSHPSTCIPAKSWLIARHIFH